MTKKIFTLLLLVVAGLSVSAKDIKEYVVTTFPQMTCQNCENKIKKNLRFEKGITDIKTDLSDQLVTISYDADKTNEAAIDAAFGKLDYKVLPATKENVKEVRATASKTAKLEKAAQTAPAGKLKAGAACTKAHAGCAKAADGCAKTEKSAGKAECKKAEAGECKKAAALKKAHACKKEGGCKKAANGECKDECKKEGTSDCCKNKK